MTSSRKGIPIPVRFYTFISYAEDSYIVVASQVRRSALSIVGAIDKPTSYALCGIHKEFPYHLRSKLWLTAGCAKYLDIKEPSNTGKTKPRKAAGSSCAAAGTKIAKRSAKALRK